MLNDDDMLTEVYLFGTCRREKHSSHIVFIGLVVVVVNLSTVAIHVACG